MKYYTLTGTYSTSTFLLSEIESIITTAQKKNTYDLNSENLHKVTYFVVVNFKSSNFVRIGYTSSQERDAEYSKLKDIWMSTKKGNWLWKL